MLVSLLFVVPAAPDSNIDMTIGTTILQGPWFMNNHASRNGGGLAVMNAITDFYVWNAMFNSNTAMRGGGAHVDTAKSLRFSTISRFKEVAPTQFVNNRAVSGGGVLAIPRSLQGNSIEVIQWRLCVFIAVAVIKQIQQQIVQTSARHLLLGCTNAVKSVGLTDHRSVF